MANRKVRAAQSPTYYQSWMATAPALEVAPPRPKRKEDHPALAEQIAQRWPHLLLTKLQKRLAIGTIAVLAAGGVWTVHLWSAVAETDLQAQQLVQRTATLQGENRLLAAEVAQLQAPQTILQRARALGMQPGGPSSMVVMP
ncbi:MAG: septum formation initiator family protein [Firmicutes bacterium]|nr:septum formation initiator family protein [Bacillota bacterium]